MYSLRDAERAHRLYASALEEAPMRLNRNGWEDTLDERAFVHRDEDGDVDVKVRFLDRDGNACVMRRSGESGTVNLWDEEEDEEDVEDGAEAVEAPGD